MKIINVEQLLEQPKRTLYIPYVPCVYTGEPKIKGEKRSEKSWWATDVLLAEENENHFENFEKSIKDASFEISSEVFCTDDATYNYDKGQLFVIFSKEEVKTMITTLLQCI